MLHISHSHETWGPGRKASLESPELALDPIEAVQLARLAGAVLDKSAEDLVAIAESNPLLIWEWLEAFKERKRRAEAEARYFAAAMAALSTAIPEVLRSASE